VGTSVGTVNSVGNVTSSGITKLDGAVAQPVTISADVLFQVPPSDQRPHHPMSGARTQPTQASNLVDAPVRDIEKTLDDIKSARDCLGPRTLHALRQRRIHRNRNGVCCFNIRHAEGDNEAHVSIEAGNSPPQVSAANSGL
jgi:hypothetical protein